MHRSMIAMTVVISTALTAPAATVPFTEDFTADNANWKFDSAGTIGSTWTGSSGPDGGAHVTQDFNFVNSASGSTPVFFRAQDEFNSSGNAFVGDWIAAGVTQFSMFVRHNAPEPLNFFTRFATPANFPGAAGVEFVPVAPHTWTQITFEISPTSPEIFYEGPTATYTSVFGNVGHVQVGITVSETLAGVDQTFTFQLDQPAIVPEPGALGLLALLGLSLRRRR